MSLQMSSKLLGSCGRLKKYYCTKISIGSIVVGNLKNLKVGNRVRVSKLITEYEILKFADLTLDYNPIHITSQKKIVHGAYLNGLVSGVIGTKLPGAGTIVVEQLLRFPNPCYAGDTIEITVEVVSIRKIIKCKYKCVANMERLVLEGEAKLILGESTIQKIGTGK
ncbi:(R)-specific enoyl-CoA hydratase-like [Athalia rosae]|uniref:(R)-specific enoyl-CoA hydratase-like n=1 Tax=Athalia rosae TaxID=37344 RepID=UPI00203397F8|nr:(R)-specific enoyl-CoA hydratase-like [Athalia rosae]